MKDYSKYFKGPSLKDARSRGRTEVQHLDDAFEIPADMVGIGKGQTYYIQPGLRQVFNFRQKRGRS